MRFRAVGIGLLLAALGGCGSGAPASNTTSDTGAEADVPKIAMPSGDLLSFAVDKVGPFNVGHATRDVSYTPPGQSSPRTLSVEIWYPSLDAEGENPRYLSLFRDADVFENASLAPPVDPKGYPVHLYSHGHLGFAATSSDMAHWFASHGWLYVAPNHLGNTLGGSDKRSLAIYYLRATDLTATLDHLEKLPASDPLAGRAQTSKVVLSGHSFGAYTTWGSAGAPFDTAAIDAKCAAGDVFEGGCRAEELAIFAKGVKDPRVVAAIPMAGGNHDMYRDYDAPNLPVLLMSGSDDVSGQPIFDRVSTLDLTWLEFAGGCHQLFALGGCPKFEEKAGWALVNTHALAFARRFVLGDASARTTKIITGEESLDARITVRHKGTLSAPASL